jgi:dTDP-4-amino-4,6-dideoxygalactose transaminase
MRIPSLDMKAHIAPIRKEIDKAIKGVMDKGGFILGDEVKTLEQEVCAYTGSKYARGVSNGTDAITLSLLALGLKQGDRVICPAFTYYATAGAVAHAGCVPAFADIDPKTYCISMASVKRILSDKRHDTNNIKAIIPVHLYGQCADMGSILAVAKEYKLKVIEDTAQAFGAVCHPGRNNKCAKAGTIGNCGTISFFPGKNLGACGDAGMVLAQDKATAERLQCLRNQGADTADKYRHILLGRNNRLDAVQAAILSVKLKYIDKWNKKRAENASYYNKLLNNTELGLPFVPEGNTHIYHQYTLRAKDTVSRDNIIKKLREKGVDSRTFYSTPLHLQPCFSYLNYKKGDFPESERVADEVFSIPVYPELTVEQMDYIVGCIREQL